MSLNVDPSSGAGALIAGLTSLSVVILGFLLIRLVARTQRARAWPGAALIALRAVDAVTVKGGSWLVGTRFRHWLPRWGALVLVLLGLAIAGAFLPHAWGLWALVLGLLAIFIVFRHWSWDEDEVEREVAKDSKRIKIEGDLGPEMLVAVAFIFVYAPIAFARLQAIGYGFTLLPGAGLFVFVGYTFLEVLKAIPVIDYYEIFAEELRFDAFLSARAPSVSAKWATLVLRASFDLILLAGLFRLRTIALRAAEGLDLRPIEEMLKTGDREQEVAAVARLSQFALVGRVRARDRLIGIVRDDRLGASGFVFGPEVRGQAANGLTEVGSRRGDDFALYRAIDAYRELLKEYTRERVPLEWARTQNNLGTALKSLGERETNTERLIEGVAAYREALKERTRERVPLDWAATQNNLGNALWRLGEREAGTTALIEALTAYREALKEWTRERVPLDWAATQDNLGIALQALGEREGGTEHLIEAVTAHREALKERTRERVPLEWARTQNNFGNALWRLGAREAGTERLIEAVAAFSEALKERTRERVPLEWARTQNNLGNALWRLGAREAGTERLIEALTAYREALKEWTRERVPLDWATAQNNLGSALQALGERQSGTERLSEAVAAFREALKEWTRERVPLDWATAQHNLGAALRWIAERGMGTNELTQSVEAFREALKERTRERVPLDWAMTQDGLGSALQALGDRENNTERLIEGVAAYREALKERPRERVPLDWARTQIKLGAALANLGEREENLERFYDAKGVVETVIASANVGDHAGVARQLLAAINDDIAKHSGGGRKE